MGRVYAQLTLEERRKIERWRHARVSVNEMARVLQPRFGRDYPLPTRALPKFLVWLVGPFVGLKREFVAKNVDHVFRADNSKSKRELGVTYRPLGESMEEMLAQMAERGALSSSK